MKNRIGELRKESGLTLVQLGKLLGLKDNTLSQYETGKRNPSLEVLEKISGYFNVSIPYLIFATNERNNSDEYLLDIGKEFYFHLIKSSDTQPNILAALKYFDEKTINQLIIASVRKMLSIPALSDYEDKLEIIKGNFRLSYIMEDVFLEEYFSKVKTNTNLINKVQNNITQVFEIEEYPEIHTAEIPIKNGFIFTRNISKSVDSELITEISHLVLNFQNSLNELTEKFPDREEKSVYEFYFVDENEKAEKLAEVNSNEFKNEQELKHFAINLVENSEIKED
ncbi:helix-turn-helix domain-containing protein [Macrococcus brunensis]|uniref:helix-turn-helix domain-containing protein n=1 Tax=Macrococcus brunensis TaxID=198483 RepID=UPI001EF09E05|nr:helix-turn-helix transcriptional regulator [Macrococcus brunensis]ULG71182.1 helix-turn-helix domain-containing protein [Macrococcus brunensis]